MSDGGGNGLGTPQLLARQVLAAPAATFDFPNLPQTFSHLELVLVARASSAVLLNIIAVSLNADAADANYDQEMQINAAAAATASELRAAAGSRGVGYATDTASPANHFATSRIFIPGYGNGARFKTVHFQCAGWGSRGAGAVQWRHGMVGWADISAIARVTLTPATAANFVAGSSCDVYGIP